MVDVVSSVTEAYHLFAHQMKKLASEVSSEFEVFESNVEGLAALVSNKFGALFGKFSDLAGVREPSPVATWFLLTSTPED